MSGGGGSQTVTQIQDIPEYERRGREYILNQAQNNFENQTPQYYPGNTVTPISPYTEAGVDSLANFANSPFQQNLVTQGTQSMAALNNMATGASNPSYNFIAPTARGAQDALNLAAQGSGQSSINPVNVDPTQSFYNPTGQTAAGGLGDSVQRGTASAINEQLARQPGSNPYVESAVNNALAANSRNFNEQVLPQMRMGEVVNGTFGGSRGGVAEGLAAERLARANSDAATQAYMNAYESDSNRNLQAAQLGAGAVQAGTGADLNSRQLDQDFATAQGQNAVARGQLNLAGQTARAQDSRSGTAQGLQSAGITADLLSSGQNFAGDAAFRALSAMPTLQNTALTGFDTQLRAGDIDRSYREQLLADEINRFNYSQNLPASQLGQLANTTGLGNFTGGGTNSQTSPQSSGGVLGAIGGGLGGYALANAVGAFGGAGATTGLAGALGAAAGPVGWGIAGLGALLGAFG